MKSVTSVTLDKEVLERGKILAKLTDKSFSELVNELLERETEVEEFSINGFKEIANAPKTRVSQPVRV